jgi:hypothetical protein
MNITPIESQVKILSELWVDYRDQEAFEALFEYADIAFPLAFAIDYGIVELTDRASAHVQEAFNLFLLAVDAEDIGFSSLGQILLDENADDEEDEE